MSIYTENFTYFWVIKNPQYCTEPTGKFIESPKFRVPQFWDSEWYLRLYPQGCAVKNKGSTSCFMYRGHDCGPDTIKIKNTLSLSSGNTSSSATTVFEKNCLGWGYNAFLPKVLNSYEKTVVVIWEMQCELNNLKTSEEQSSNTTTPEEHASYSFPTKCFAQTKFLYETKFIQRPIDSVISSTYSKITIPVILQENYPPLVINLQSNSMERFDLNLSLMNSAFKESIMVICEISVKTNIGVLLHSFEEKHNIKAGKDWSLRKNINKSHFTLSRFKILISHIAHLNDLSLNKINLEGNFSFSFGKVISEIVGVEREKISRNLVLNREYISSNEMFLLYKENKCCDFSLKIGNETVEVHKVVLGSASPVFAAMFSNEMAEKNDVVDIVDVDKETVLEMVSFMYTGFVKELEYESAIKLYIAGYKYEISSMMDVVRNAMINFFHRNTICDILYIADAHNDHKLYKEALKFFKLNKTTILSSADWETFTKENGNLAAKCLTEVCLLNKRKIFE